MPRSRRISSPLTSRAARLWRRPAQSATTRCRAGEIREKGTSRIRAIRRFFRAQDKDEATREKRLKMLRSLYKKRFLEQFPGREAQLADWTSPDGLQLATEKINLYPLYFEDWVDTLMHKAQDNAAAAAAPEAKPDNPEPAPETPA